MKKSTYFLLTLVILLLAFIFLIEKRQKTTTEIEESKTKAFGELFDDIVLIERSGYEELKIEKEGDEYFIKEPIYDIADESSVKGFIDSLKESKAERLIKENVDLSKLGLVNPQLTILIKGKENKEKKILIGSSPPLEKGAYFKADEKIGVLSDFTLETLKRSVKDFRNKELCSPLKMESVKKIAFFKDKKLSLELEKQGTKWFVTFPFKDIADERKSSFFVEDILIWPVMNFEEESVGNELTRLNDPQEKYEIESFDGKKVIISIGALKDEEKKFYYASVSTRNGVFIISKNSVRNIDKDGEYFRSLQIFPDGLGGFEQLTLENTDKIILKNVKEKGWIEEKSKIKEDQIKTFLYSLEYLEGEKKVDKIENLPIFVSLSLLKGSESIERVFYEDKESLVVKISERNILVSLSKEDSERVKGAVRAIYAQYKENNPI
ncbi:MAG: DUF4340 domain-containing protein [Acidobacteria bacterium]|nr:DUF4340 domain-containing protein [Acidobacteriota bacterium]